MLHLGLRITTRNRVEAFSGFTASFSAQVAHDAVSGPLGLVTVTGAQGAVTIVGGEVFGATGVNGGLFTVTESAGFILVDFDRNGLGDALLQGESVYTSLEVTLSDTATTRSVDLNISIARANTAPVALLTLPDLSLDQGVAISPVDLSADFLDPGDSLSFTATGVPNGLDVSGAGLLTGAPTEPVTAQVVNVIATDSIGQQAASSFQITVAGTQTASTDPNVNSIGVDGWRVDYTAPGTFDPVGDPRYVVAERNGFDALGNSVSVFDSLLLTTRVREPYPNQANLTAGDVAMSDFVYSSDVVAGVTNQSTRLYPAPQAMWLNHDREHATGAAHTVRLAVVHAHARNGRPVASVTFTATDETGNSTAVTVSATSLITYSGSGLSVPHFEANIDLSGLVQGELVTVDATIYPWVGDAFTISTDADAYPSPNLTVLTFLNDRTGGFGTAYAYVDGVGASPAVNSDPVTARTTPYATISAAAAAVQSFNSGTFGRANASGGIIRLEPGVHTHASFSATAVGELPLVIEAADPAQKASTIYQDAGSSSSNGIPDRLKLRNVTIRRNATGSVIFLDNNATSGSENMLITEGCTWNDNGLGPSWGAWVYRVGRFWNIDCDGVNCAHGAIFSSVFKTMIGIGSGNGSIQTATYHAAGCKDLNGTFEINVAAAHRPASAGDFAGWCHIGQGVNAERCVNFEDWAIGSRGAAIVGCILEQYGGTFGPCFYIGGDGDVSPIENVTLHCNTSVGSRSNLAYQDAGAVRVDKTLTQRFCVHQSRNTKSDVFATNGNLVGNWPVIFQVGCAANSMLEASAAGDIPGVGSWLGEIASIGEVNGTSAAPLDPDWLDDRSISGAGGGNGVYVPGAASDLPTIPAGLAPYSHDQLGTPVANDGSARAGALQP